MSENEVLSMLEIKCTYNASQETVFDALTKPEIMAKWFYGMDMARAEVESDFRVGGEYVIRMFKEDGSKSDCAEYAPHGEFLEIDAPNKVAFTWISEGFVEHSVVTISFEAVDSGTELTLRHELPEQVLPPHREGWNSCLENLEGKCFVSDCC
ncbi:MAG: SRPBCC domain-containing protein [Opitutaceae bacterium]|jgi:uncharacterized protein YndB with AHSA1/START domain|nr:SRPBCC domain-containing protein [Opitutaceae bacterium]|tara:strand:- start:397 stop:855 length:459 start_codon:yes stop_codon:yes gene_type:complete